MRLPYPAGPTQNVALSPLMTTLVTPMLGAGRMFRVGPQDDSLVFTNATIRIGGFKVRS